MRALVAMFLGITKRPNVVATDTTRTLESAADLDSWRNLAPNLEHLYKINLSF